MEHARDITTTADTQNDPGHTLAGGDLTHAETSADSAPKAPKAPNEVDLDEPIVRGAMKITRVALRKPASGELRGLTLNALANLDVESLHKLIPRISTPMLTRQEAENLNPADLLQFGGVIGGFLLTKHAKASMDLPTA